jgi:hypothetical protein
MGRRIPRRQGYLYTRARERGYRRFRARVERYSHWTSANPIGTSSEQVAMDVRVGTPVKA